MKIALYPGSKSMDRVLYVVTRSTPIRLLPPIQDPLQTTPPPREAAQIQAPVISEQLHHHGYPICLEVEAARGVGPVIHHRNLGNGLERIRFLLGTRIWIKKRFSSSLEADMFAACDELESWFTSQMSSCLGEGRSIRGDTPTIHVVFRFFLGV
jgi:hypothetical protein